MGLANSKLTAIDNRFSVMKSLLRDSLNQEVTLRGILSYEKPSKLMTKRYRRSLHLKHTTMTTLSKLIRKKT